GIIGLRRDWGQLAGFRRAGAERKFRFASGGDVLHRADDAQGMAIRRARDRLGAGINPAPFTGLGADPILGLDEGGAAIALAGDPLAVQRQIVGVNEGLPGLAG